MGLSRFSARDARAVPDFIYELFPVLREMKQRRGGDLSGGQQQQLAIGRALASQPRLLILDEPTEGIQPSVIKEIGTVVRSLAARGDMAILLVEQFYDFAAELADQYLVMARGEIVQQAAAATWRARACAGWWRFERTGTHCRWRNRGLRWQSLCPRLSAGGRNDRHSAPGRQADAGFAALCVAAAYAPWIAVIGRKPWPMTQDYHEVIASDRVLIAEHDGQPVGLLVTRETADGFLVDNLAVLPECKGQGIGRQLLERAERDATSLGYRSLYLYTNERMTENIALYARVGYLEYERRQEEGFRRVFMRKALA